MSIELTKEEVLADDLRYNLRPWAVQSKQKPFAVQRAEGVFFWDYDGKRYFDMSSQLVNSNLGHANKELINEIKDQLDAISYIAPAHAVAPRSKLARMLIERAPDNMAKVFFTCGGAESNDNAILMARAVTGRSKVFSSYRSYHGSTHGSGNLSGDPRRFAAERPATAGYVKFFTPYIYQEQLPFKSEADISSYYLNLLREQIISEGAENVASISLETIAGTNGVIILPEGYLAGVRKLCDEFKILLHFDEVMVGFGRTGKMFACENFDVKPDLLTFAKGITCGYVPLGGVIVSKAIAAFYDNNPLLCGLTYNGHPLACAAGVAALNYYEKHKIFEHVQKTGKVLERILLALEEKHKSIGNVRCIGLFSAIELVKDKKTKQPLVPYGNNVLEALSEVVGLLAERGFATIGRKNSIMIAPPLVITEEQLMEALQILDDVLDIVDERYCK